MRYIEFMNERDEEAVIKSLRDIIARPSSNEGERENARRSLARILGKKSGEEKFGDVLPDFKKGEKPKQSYGGFEPYPFKKGQKVDIKA